MCVFACIYTPNSYLSWVKQNSRNKVLYLNICYIAVLGPELMKLMNDRVM